MLDGSAIFHALITRIAHAHAHSHQAYQAPSHFLNSASKPIKAAAAAVSDRNGFNIGLTLSSLFAQNMCSFFKF